MEARAGVLAGERHRSVDLGDLELRAAAQEHRPRDGDLPGRTGEIERGDPEVGDRGARVAQLERAERGRVLTRADDLDPPGRRQRPVVLEGGENDPVAVLGGGEGGLGAEARRAGRVDAQRLRSRRDGRGAEHGRDEHGARQALPHGRGP